MLSRSRTWAAVIAALLSVVLVAGSAEAYSPSPGPAFNNPTGTRAEKNRLQYKLVKAINHVPRHQTIRIASYSFDRRDIADALIRAHDRGVDVQVVVNDNWTSTATLRLRTHLGVDPSRRSFVTICAGSCRGGAGNQHMKFFIFTKTGKARNVLMVGSNNPTGYAAVVHWNDLFTINGSKAMVELYTKVFEQLVRDRRVKHPYIVKTIGPWTSWFYPHPRTTKKNDPVMKRLRRVSCSADRTHGSGGHTVIRVVMYGWNRDRGIYLAEKMAGLDRRGCDVRALLSSAGGKVVRILKRGGVAVRSASLDADNNPETGFEDGPYDYFVHEKWMALSGGYAGAQGHHVWTGSENWSGLSMINDEVTLHVARRAAYRKYLANFNLIWDHHSRPFE